MRKSVCFSLLAVMAILFSVSSFAQVRLSGTVSDQGTGSAAQSVSVTVKSSTTGTVTDASGRFELTVPSLPVILVFSSIGFESQEVTVDNPTALIVLMTPVSSLGQEVVVAATRTPQRILESPVTIERVSSAAIRNAPAASYYDVLSNVKGVDITTSSLTFKTPTTRGFSGSGNLRLNQLIDGMDNQAPGLNFSVGSVIGISELDVESMELLPGASSALYGPGGMNGTLLINSKNPFRSEGLSLQVKQGIMHLKDNEREASPYYNWNVRWAKAFNDKIAFKISTDLISAKDWLAQDYRNYRRLGTSGTIIPGTRQTDPQFDGVNIYGDETRLPLNAVLRSVSSAAPFLAPYISTLLAEPDSLVTRTGYKEKDVVSPNTVNLKLNGAVHYKIRPNLEASFSAYWGTGNTVYTGSDRYSLKNLKIGQYKLELKADNWMLRGYTTQENAGESFNASATTAFVNEAWKPSGGSTGWLAQYGQAYVANRLAGQTRMDAHNNARATADIGRPAEGSVQFKQLFDQVRSIPISQGGGLFVDKTDLYNIEGQYNLSSFLNGKANLLVGGNWKQYVLKSQGTIFADSANNILINEVGAYFDASRQIAERLKLSVSGRYDKNENFKGRFTPRATATLKLFENNNLRFSYQQAYRFPSTQQQWIDLTVGGGVQLIGGVQELRSFYGITNNNLYSLKSVQQGAPKISEVPDVKPETVQSFEVGYRGLNLGGKFLIDAYGYYGQYTDFIVRFLGIRSTDPTGRVFSIPTNSQSEVKTYGFGIGLDYRLPKGFAVSGNFASDNLEDIPAGFISFFNAPKYRSNISISNNGFGFEKRAGFSVSYKWQDDFFYEGDFANGLVPEIHTLDAQVSYKVPSSKSVIKIGANNLLNEYYRNAAGNPSIGGLYYISFGYNVF